MKKHAMHKSKFCAYCDAYSEIDLVGMWYSVLLIVSV